VTLISHEYRDQQRQMHAAYGEHYGVASATYAPIVSRFCNELQITSLLDYGCAQCGLFKSLKVDHKMTLQAYDPGIEQYSEPPIPSQMVTCIDVLEHIEPDCLNDVLDDLARLTLEVGIFSVCMAPAKKVLPDGRNAHLIQQPIEWWLPKFWERFDLQSFQRMDEWNFFCVCYSKPRIEVAS